MFGLSQSRDRNVMIKDMCLAKSILSVPELEQANFFYRLVQAKILT